MDNKINKTSKKRGLKNKMTKKKNKFNMKKKSTPNKKTTTPDLHCSTEENMPILCVMCGYKKGLKPISGIFSNQQKLLTYSDAIFDCYNIQFLDKHFTKDIKLCGKCIAKLSYCYAFRKDVERAHQKLYLIEDMPIEEISENDQNSSDVKSQTEDTPFYINIEYEDDNDCVFVVNNKEPIIEEESGSVFDIDDSAYILYISDNDEVFENDFNDQDYDSDWSVSTDEINRATGYQSEWEKIRSKKRFVVPYLDKTIKECPICLTVFENRNDLIKHHTAHFPLYLCDICGESFSTCNQFKCHEALVHFCHKTKCPGCSKIFKSFENMKVHFRRIHEGYKTFKCHVCEKRFDSSRNRQKHYMKEHNMESSKRKCTMCDELFDKYADLRSHLVEKHFDKAKSKCVDCHLVFRSKHELKRHNTKHTKLREFVCNICEKGFLRAYHLTTHYKTHLKKKLFECNACEDTFLDKDTLKSHNETHSIVDGLTLETSQ